MSTANRIHGHEVIRLVLASDGVFTRDALREAIVARFGADARFHTCSAADLTADGIIDFLAERGKVVLDEDGRLHSDPGRMCSHPEA